MVKLSSARKARLYGTPGTRDLLENLNAFLYLLGTILLTAWVLLLLPSYNIRNTGLWLSFVGLAIIVLVNFHDLHAHLAGTNYNFRLLSLDTQLWLVELAAPVVQAIVSILLCIVTFLLIRANKGAYDKHGIHLKLVQAFRLVVAGSALWLLGAIHNALQGYEKANLQVQVLQKAVSLPFLVASQLLLLSGVLPLQVSDRGVGSHNLIALVASGVLVSTAVLNAIRVRALQQVDRYGTLHQCTRMTSEFFGDF